MALLTFRAPVNYEEQLASFKDFIQSYKTSKVSLEDLRIDSDGEGDGLSDDYDFVDDADIRGTTSRAGTEVRSELKYKSLLQEVADRKRTHITVELDDLQAYEKGADDPALRLVASIEKNAQHYLDIFSRAIDECLPEPTEGLTFKNDVVDVILNLRKQQTDYAQAKIRDGTSNERGGYENVFPPELLRRYTIGFKPVTFSASSATTSKALAIRSVRGEHLGHLITVRGIATRVSDVKPAVQVTGYVCDRCGHEIFQPILTKTFTPLIQCPSDDCVRNGAQGALVPVPRISKFSPFQEIKIQEMADQVPIGHIPRQLTVHCLGGLVRQINPGDVMDIAGIFLPTPYTGFQAMRAGLLADTYLEAQFVRMHKKAYDEMTLAPPLLRRMDELERSGRLYEILSRSIAPEIFGHEDVKKALLLQLIGGVSKEMGDGMRVRGDINICLMGDPGVAKSQLLKYISKVAPRGVYTTGRGSSGVGLTAAVVKDPVTDEMLLEGGALVLADNGMCCIDEFDKMDDSDRTAIHEVMEQQTISISKAGITTTLNARTSILAAANPLYGRYNPRISPVENINLPAALLSRFDVLFLILDVPSRDADEELARHVTHVHIHNSHPQHHSDGAGTIEIFNPVEVRQWIARARTFRPVVPKSVADYLVSAYMRMRQQQKRDEDSKKLHTHTTPRTLLGIIRLAQALARLRFSEQVVVEDVDEALRLVEVSKASLYDNTRHQGDQTPSSKIYHLIRAMEASGAAAVGSGRRGELSMQRVRERVLAKGFTDDQFEEAIMQYSLLDIWQTAADGTRLVFIEAGAEDEMDF